MPLIHSPPPALLGRAPATHYLLFLASGTPSWCPDCRHAQPHLDSIFKPEAAPTCFALLVGEREEWKGNNTHWARTQYGVKGVPTLIKWSEGKEVARLEEEGCQDPAQLKAFVTDSDAKA